MDVEFVGPHLSVADGPSHVEDSITGFYASEERVAVRRKARIVLIKLKGNEFENIDSKILLRKTIDIVATKGYTVGNIDATVCAERPKLNPHIPQMQQTLAEVMNIDPDCVSIKATTSEKLGFTGREEGISAYAVVLLEK